jgi:hypothetical protein
MVWVSALEAMGRPARVYKVEAILGMLYPYCAFPALG